MQSSMESRLALAEKRPAGIEVVREYLRRMAGRSVRPMTLEDVGAVVQIHRTALPGFFLTSLGPKFLALYYAAVVRSDLGISLVFVRQGQVRGFAVGTLDPRRFYRQLFKRRCLAFGWYSLGALARRPRILQRMARAVLDRLGAPHGPEAARLASLAVAPEEQGRGFGLALMVAWIERARELGARRVALEVMKDDQNLIRAYEQLGFRPVRETRKPLAEPMLELRSDSVGEASTT